MRLFIGIELRPIVNDLAKLQEVIYPYYKGNLVGLDKLHVTLKFLGKTNPGRIAKKLSAVNQPKFEATTNGLGVFPTISNPKVVFVGVNPQSDFLSLHKAINIALGIKTTNYTPHITLGRIKEVENSEKFLEELNKTRTPIKFSVEKFTLYSSQLTSLGPIYTKIKDYELK